MNLSKGAQKIFKILKTYHMNFLLEYEFNDLKGKKKTPLRFDFAIFNYGKLIALIEYDGEAHFNRIKHFHSKTSDFARAQERDRVKNKYCLLHNIPLYRIPYFEIDNINTLQDLFNPKYRVKSKYHNDYIEAP